MGEWVNMAEAGSRLGVSVRTLQRRLKQGRHETRLTGRRKEVLLDTPGTNGGQEEHAKKFVPPATGQGEQQIRLAARAEQQIQIAVVSVNMADKLVRAHEAAARRARRSAWAGWATAAALLIVIAGLGILAVAELAERDVQIAAAEQHLINAYRTPGAAVARADSAFADVGQLQADLIDPTPSAPELRGELATAETETTDHEDTMADRRPDFGPNFGPDLAPETVVSQADVP